MMEPINLMMLGKLVNASLRVLTDQLLTTVALLICGVLFGWVLYAPDWIRLAGASAFAILVYLPLVRAEARKQQPQEPQQ